MHVNLVVKGVPTEEIEEFSWRVRERWCARVDAVPEAQCVKSIHAAGGIIKYVALHFQKESQAPPEGWRGHRTSQTRDYLVRPASQLRKEARRSLRLKNALYHGADRFLAELEQELLEGELWSMVKNRPSSVDLSVPGALSPAFSVVGRAQSASRSESIPETGPRERVAVVPRKRHPAPAAGRCSGTESADLLCVRRE
jgi:hypothetical protein